MSQISPRFCPQCNSPVTAGQRFCPNCGATLSSDSVTPTAFAASGMQSGQYGMPPTEVAGPPSPLAPPPPSTGPDYLTPSPLMPSTGPNFGMSSPSYQSYQTPGAPPYTSYPPQTPYSAVSGVPNASMPPYAQPKKNSKGLLFAIIGGVLVLVLVIGGIAAAVISTHKSNNGTNGTTGTTSGQGSNTSNGAGSGSNTSSSGSLTQSEQLNLSITYSSVIMTFTSVQQASTFSDDSFINQPGVVRVNFKEQNTTTSPSFYTYTDSFRLVLPDGSTVVAPINSQNDIGPDQSVTRTNWVDFPVATKVDLSKLTLRLGASGEVATDVPLSPNADLSKYQPKTFTPGAKTNYAGMNWTVTSVVVSLSSGGKEATTGNEYITVNLTVSNPTSNDFFGFDYIRLQSNGTTNSATDESQANEPSQVSAGTTNVKGSATFLMPSTDTSFTLIFLAQDQISQATTTFTLS